MAAHARGCDEDIQKQSLMRAAALYAKMLQLASGSLDEGHATLMHARTRLAEVMVRSGATRSQANALPLCLAVLRALRPCVPPHWPQLLPPLRHAATAAAAAGDVSAAEALRTEHDRLLVVLSPGCADVA